MSWVEAWPALGTFNSSISFSRWSRELLADARQRLLARTARPRASPGLDAVALWLCLLSHSQDNLQPNCGVCLPHAGTTTALGEARKPQQMLP